MKILKRTAPAYILTAHVEGAGYMDHYELYKDIQVRTKGEIYIGVVGPVRTGKSTFIKRFMDVLVLPHLEDENVKAGPS